MKSVNLSPVDINENDINSVVKALNSGWLAHGQENKSFEKEFAEYLDVDKAISLNSCTSALDLALRCHNFPKGSEVIIPSFTWVSTGNVVVLNGLIPVFADINISDFQIDPKSICDLISSKTVAIIGVHFSGLMCDTFSIEKICKSENLVFIEDSAECLGVTRDGRKPGSTGIGCFSFYPTKNMTTCEGGMLTTNDSSIDRICRSLSAHGIEKSTFDRVHDIPDLKPNWYREASTNGFNFRMPNPLAALGRSQLKRLDEMVTKRQYIASQYNEVFSNIQNIKLPKYQKSIGESSYQMYVFRLDNNQNKSKIIQSLREKGVAASSHFDPPLHKQKAFCEYKPKISLKNTELISDSIISLPMSSALTNDDISHVCRVVSEIFT